MADLLPGDLLNSLNGMEVDTPGGVEGLINNVPPEVLNLMVGFLGGEAWDPYWHTCLEYQAMQRVS